MPGIRFAFFVAAGVAGLRTGPVLAWATASAVAWNSLLLGLGLWLGQHADALAVLVQRYTLGVGAIVAVVVAVSARRLLAPERDAR